MTQIRRPLGFSGGAATTLLVGRRPSGFARLPTPEAASGQRRASGRQLDKLNKTSALVCFGACWPLARRHTHTPPAGARTSPLMGPPNVAAPSDGCSISGRQRELRPASAFFIVSAKKLLPLNGLYPNINPIGQKRAERSKLAARGGVAGAIVRRRDESGSLSSVAGERQPCDARHSPANHLHASGRRALRRCSATPPPPICVCPKLKRSNHVAFCSSFGGVNRSNLSMAFDFRRRFGCGRQFAISISQFASNSGARFGCG